MPSSSDFKITVMHTAHKKFETISVRTVPQIGSSVDMFDESMPTVQRVIMYPQKNTLFKLISSVCKGFPTEVEKFDKIQAVVLVQ